MGENAIEMRGINKQFNNIWVLKNVCFSVMQGEVHSIFGENGAGKSVLMKILSGVISPDAGEIKVFGKNVSFNDPYDAQSCGIRTIFQEQNLIPDLSVAENIYISKVPSFTNRFHMINRKEMFARSSKVLKNLGFDIDPKRIVRDLGTGERQLVEIAKALVYNSNVIIMDEPTGALTDHEIDKLYGIIRNLKKQGISVVYISHRIEEVLKISDRITIMRDGEVIQTLAMENMSKELLINLSAGQDFKERYPKLPVQKGRVFFKAANLKTERKISNISLEVRKGEIVGIAGLVGSGRTAIARAIFGIDRLLEGDMYLNGTRLNLSCPKDAIDAGIGYITEDRLSEGLIGEFTIPFNISLSNMKTSVGKIFLKVDFEREVARKFVKKLVIKTPFLEQKAKNLSGGNQQKLVLSKWLFHDSKLFIFDEPTMGLDTGSKVEVYNIMNEIALNQSGIILISSDISELIGMCDRIIVIFNGQIKGELSRKEFSVGKILAIASGDKREAT